MHVHDDQTSPQAPVQSPSFYVGIMLMLTGLAFTLGGRAPLWISIPVEMVGAILIGLTVRPAKPKPRA